MRTGSYPPDSNEYEKDNYCTCSICLPKLYPIQYLVVPQATGRTQKPANHAVPNKFTYLFQRLFNLRMDMNYVNYEILTYPVTFAPRYIDPLP